MRVRGNEKQVCVRRFVELHPSGLHTFSRSAERERERQREREREGEREAKREREIDLRGGSWNRAEAFRYWRAENLVRRRACESLEGERLGAAILRITPQWSFP